MDEKDFDVALERVIRENPRFTREAYCFLYETLDCAAQLNALGEDAPEEDSEFDLEDDEDDADDELDEDDETDEDASENDGHITGETLCRVATSYAVARFGLMARVVLATMGFRSTGDIGDLVYLLIEAGLLEKTPEDSREDFDDLFDLGDALDAAFQFHYGKKRG